MVFEEIWEIIFSIDSCIEFLRGRQVLHTAPQICPECNASMTEAKDSSKGGKHVWWCRSHRNVTKLIRHGVVPRKISPDFIILTDLWAGNSTVKMAEEFLDLSKKTVIKWFNLYRDICSKWMVANSPAIAGVCHVV